MQGLGIAHSKAFRTPGWVPYERNEPLRIIAWYVSKPVLVNVIRELSKQSGPLGQRCLSIVQAPLARGRVAHRMRRCLGLGDGDDTSPSLELAAMELAAPHSDVPQLLVITREIWHADYAPLVEEEYLANKAVGSERRRI